MSAQNGESAPILTALERILRTLLAALAIALAILSLIVFCLRPHRQAAASPGADQSQSSPGESVFTEIGRLRAVSRDAPPATIVVTISFPWDERDIAFTEELSAKVPRLRDIAAAWFATKTAAELRAQDEGALKKALLERFNAELSLGKLKRLFISDYAILD